MSEQDIKMLDNMMNSTSCNAVQFDAETELCMLDDELIVKIVTSCCTKVCRVRDVIWTADIAPAEIVKSYEIIGITTNEFVSVKSIAIDKIASEWVEVLNSSGKTFFVESDYAAYELSKVSRNNNWLAMRSVYDLNDAPFLTFK